MAIGASAMAADDAPIATTAAAAAAPAAEGQAAQGGTTVQEVVVTGIRGSLQKSLNVKKNSSGIVDAISAEDIGKFPDSNLAQAMERVPGVTVSRGSVSVGGTPTSTGQPTTVTVRGFGPQFNETLYDGRYVSSANGRTFDFSAVGSDFVKELDVMKTPDATLTSGAIGATINIQFAKPFDHPGLRLSGSASASINDNAGDPTPNGSLLFSDTFAHDTMGILVDWAYSDFKNEQNHVNNQGWIGTDLADPSQYAGTPQPSNQHWIWGSAAQQAAAPYGPHWFTQDYGIYQEHLHEWRTDGRVVYQWRPASNFLLTLNDNFSRDTIKNQEYGVTWWFNGANATNAISQVQTNSHGTVTNFVTNGGYGKGGEPTDFQSQFTGAVTQNNDFGINAKWDVNDQFKLELDGDHAESWLNPGGQMNSVDADVGYGDNLNNTQIGITGLGNNSVPYPNGYGPGGDKSNFVGNGIIGSHVVPLGSQYNYDAVNQAKLMGTWQQEHLKVRFGAQYVSDKEHLKGTGDIFTSMSDNDWQAYSGYGPPSGNATGVTMPASIRIGSFSTANFISGYTNNDKLPAQIPMFDGGAIIHYLEGLGNPATKNIPGFNCASAWESGCATPGHYNGTFRAEVNPSSVQVINEETFSLFADGAYDTQWADMPVKINFGARVDRTRTKSVGLSQVPTGALTHVVGDPTALGLTLGPVSSVAYGNQYTYFLPNLDAKLYVLPNLVLRADLSRTESKQPLGDLKPDLGFGAPRIGNITANGGNPFLLPDISDNFDVGAEWYYKKNSYLSVDAFQKQIKNFEKGGTYTTTYPGVTLPADMGGGLAQFTVSSQTNEGAYKVHGVEMAWQNVFGDSGFGYQANVTLVKSDHPYNPLDLVGTNVVAAGLADSWNVIGFYDKAGFQARIAVNWSDNVLSKFGQGQPSTIFGVEPTFVKAATYVDFTTSYDVNPHITVYFEALNLTDQVYQTYGRWEEQLLDVLDTGRRFNMGFRFKM